MATCPRILASGHCQIAGCKLRHTVSQCDTCGIIFQSDHALEVHLKSKRHRAQLTGTSLQTNCTICNIVVTGVESWRQHVSGNRHKRKAIQQGLSAQIDPEVPILTPTSTRCETCGTLIPNHMMSRHQKSVQHKSKQSYARYQSALAEAELNKNGVEVVGNFNFDYVDPSAARVGVVTRATIQTSLPRSTSSLFNVKLASAQGSRPCYSPFRVAIEGSLRTISSRQPLIIVLYFKESSIGRYDDRVEFLFEDAKLKKQFIITRGLQAIVSNKVDHHALQPIAPYTPRGRFERKQVVDPVEGVKPQVTTTIKYLTKLPPANIPKHLENVLDGPDSIRKQINQLRRLFFPSAFHADTYTRFFKNLLWIEEFKMERDLERYDIEDATLTRHNSIFYLPVPGLAEKRPSVLIGDQILVQAQKINNARWYEGHVHVVRQAEVGLRFHSSFAPGFSPGTKFHIRFKLNRIPVRRQHQAMDSVLMEDRALFPANQHLRPSKAGLPRITLYNNDIASNDRQSQAVDTITALPRGSLPFIVFGPPGTGKTITVVEAILQIVQRDPNAQLLVTAPSNSAADLLAERLSTVLNEHQLFRFYAPSRSLSQVPDKLRNYVSVDESNHFTSPPLLRLKRFRAIVCTCVSASFATGVGLKRGHFSHIFVDEAGQATEPETFVSIGTLADTTTNIILSGDPKQLGPVIRSGIAREFGLELSYLERLMERDVYNLRTNGGRSIVKLTKNFRSHGTILRFPNDHFYDGDLEHCAPPEVINAYLNSSYLSAKKFPVVFHAISGKDDREASSPSFFNIEEVLQVKDYVQRLKMDRKYITKDSDIGVIAPYHAQCLKIRKVLSTFAAGVKVGSVEEFQGQERKVIIISTVRSSKEFVEYDLRHTLGFVASPRRFNVAVTRAKALLIVVGNPQVLALDPLWRSFLGYINTNKGWTGANIPWDMNLDEDADGNGGPGEYDIAIREGATRDMNDFVRRMEALTMAEVEDELDANIDRPWTNRD